MKLGVVGLGVLGGNLLRYFRESEQEARGYDIHPEKTDADFDTILKQDILFLCLPTPYREGSKGYDLSILEDTLGKIAEFDAEKIVIIKSTVLPGTTQRLQEQYPKLRLGFTPEFLTARYAWEDTLHPDTSIFGYTEQSHSIANDILRILPEASFERIIPAAEAEMVKIARNNYFVSKIVFMNALYDICQANGIDYEIVKESLASDRRIRRSHMEIFHGGGRGGSGVCFPKDQAAFRDYVEETVGGYPSEFVNLYGKINLDLVNSTGKDKGSQYYGS